MSDWDDVCEGQKGGDEGPRHGRAAGVTLPTPICVNTHPHPGGVGWTGAEVWRGSFRVVREGLSRERRIAETLKDGHEPAQR